MFSSAEEYAAFEESGERHPAPNGKRSVSKPNVQSSAPDTKVQSETTTNHLPVESIATGISIMLVLTIVQRFIGLGRNVLFCRMMSDDQLGVWSLANSFLLIAAPLAVLGLPGCFGRYVERFRSNGRLGAFLWRISIVSVIAMTVSVAMLIAGGDSVRWLIFRSNEAWLTYTITMTLVAVIVSNGLIELMNGLRQVRIASVMRLVNSALFAIVAISLIVVQYDGAFAAMIGTIAGSIAAIGIATLFLWKHRKIFDNRPSQSPSPFWTMIVPFAGWLWIMDLLSNLIEISDRYMLLHFVSGTDQDAQALLGQYYSGLVIPLILLGIGTMIGGALLPHLSHAWEKGDHRRVSEILGSAVKFLLLGFTIIGGCCLVCSPILYDFLLQGRYQVGNGVLPFTFAYCIWLAAAYVMMDYLWCAEKGKWASLGMFVGVVANIGLNLVFVPHWGLIGAVMATCIANVCLLLVTLAVCHRHGCRLHKGILPLIALPALLFAGAIPAILVPLAVVLVPSARKFFFDASERAHGVALIERVSQKIGPRIAIPRLKRRAI